MSSSLNRDEEHCQPCEAFERREGDYVRECASVIEGGGLCGFMVYACVNCGADHHDGGWQTCKGTAEPHQCQHPLCIELREMEHPVTDPVWFEHARSRAAGYFQTAELDPPVPPPSHLTVSLGEQWQTSSSHHKIVAAVHSVG